MRGSYIRYLEAYSIIHGKIGSNILLSNFFFCLYFYVKCGFKGSATKTSKNDRE